jgi:hypothetical protein
MTEVGLPVMEYRTSIASIPLPALFCAAAPQYDESLVRIASWRGDWVCPCGETHSLRHDCPDCQYPQPCRWGRRGHAGHWGK